MKLVYRNFDNLDVAFQGRVPSSILETLEAAKLEAQAAKRDAGAELGKGRMPVLVAETGARGGYAYRFDTGPDGETWFVCRSDNAEGWNVRVSAKSLALALYGYQGVKERVLDRLTMIGAEGPARFDPVAGETVRSLQESVSRFDFCADFATEAVFEPDDTRFLAHSRSRVETLEKAIPWSKVRRGRRLESIRIGAMPGRQVAVYDKTREIVVSDKAYWWDLWGLDKATFKGRVWRVEVRAGKDELRNWNIRSFADFERRAGDVTLGILKAIRYVSPNPGDGNRARWPNDPLWDLAAVAASDALAAHICKAERGKVIADLRAKVLATFRNQMQGLLPGLINAMGLDVSEAPTAVEKIADDLLQSASQAPDRLARKFDQVRARYVFLDPQASRHRPT